MVVYKAPNIVIEENLMSNLKEKTFIEEGNLVISTNSFYEPLKSLSTMAVSKNLEFEKPTAIQKYVIPIILNKRSVKVRAPTGSGKTLAFLLPLIENIKYNRIGIVICIITPTRELANQIYTEANKLLLKRNIRISLCYGGRGSDDVFKYTDILVATPGRLLANLQEKKISLSQTDYLIFDEADRLLDMGFIKQIEEIKTYVNPYANVGLFSATYHKGVDKALGEILPKAHLYVRVKNETTKNIKQTIILDERNKKDDMLLEILSKQKFQTNWRKEMGAKIIIFVEKKINADELKEKISNYKLRCEALHGGKEQSKRESILESFRSGICPILIATSLAARGIDVKDVTLVINYNFPESLKEYIHRIGRTGREGKDGESISFIDMRSIHSATRLDLIKILKESGNIVPDFLRKQVGRDNKHGDSLNRNFSKMSIAKVQNTFEKENEKEDTGGNLKLTEKIDSEDETPGQCSSKGKINLIILEPRPIGYGGSRCSVAFVGDF